MRRRLASCGPELEAGGRQSFVTFVFFSGGGFGAASGRGNRARIPARHRRRLAECLLNGSEGHAL